LPITTTCLEGEGLDLTGLVVTACYDNDTQKTVTVYTTAGYDSTPGTKTITVTYQGMTATFEVEVLAKSLTHIAVTSWPVENTYLEGKEPDFTGLVITAYYDNGTREEVTDYTLSGYGSTPGLTTVTVTYQGFTTTFSMAVMYKTMIGIEVTSLPDKRVYAPGEDLDLTGLVVTACYDNDTQVEITYYYITGYDDAPGKKTITVHYGSFTDTFTVAVGDIPGDIDRDGDVNTNDVVQLLLYLTMPDMFDIGTTPVDFTGDGNINTEDAIQLLLHISMPDLFPLA
ncbi:MAG: bacterial Ig-like domain-containing protein, partial [Oscillospiraceae bacterium]|nr:bacterial Ig-like domain-containing protein [Oscillospiraceae bacterium]